MNSDPNFSIELATAGRAVDFYMPGEIVEGNVCRIVTAEAQEIVNGLQLRWYGRAHAAWIERSMDRRGSGGHVDIDDRQVIHHLNDEVYFDSKQPLLFPSSKGDKPSSAAFSTTLESGAHRILFSFQLPLALPSSWKAPPGRDFEIKYSVVATLTRIRASDLTAGLHIQIWRPTDLNDFPALGAPNMLSASKTLCCCCCASGAVGFKLNFPKLGYAVGETIDCTLQLFNGSSTDVQKIEAKLLEIVEVRARDGAITHGRGLGAGLWDCLKQIDLPGIAPGASETFQIRMDLIPPNYRPLNLDGCTFMKTVRKISVEMTIPGALNLSASMPIGIGTIPLRFLSLQQQQQQQQQSWLGGQQSAGQQSQSQQQQSWISGQQSQQQQSWISGQQQSAQQQQQQSWVSGQHSAGQQSAGQQSFQI